MFLPGFVCCYCPIRFLYRLIHVFSMHITYKSQKTYENPRFLFWAISGYTEISKQEGALTMTDFEKLYQEKKHTIPEILSTIRSGDVIFTTNNYSEP